MTRSVTQEQDKVKRAKSGRVRQGCGHGHFWGIANLAVHAEFARRAHTATAVLVGVTVGDIELVEVKVREDKGPKTARRVGTMESLKQCQGRESSCASSESHGPRPARLESVLLRALICRLSGSESR